MSTKGKEAKYKKSGQRKKNITKFERNNTPNFRVYNYESTGYSEIHFNELAKKMIDIWEGDLLYLDTESDSFTVVKEHQIKESKLDGGYVFSLSDSPNNYYKSKTKVPIETGIYEMSTSQSEKRGHYWFKYTFLDDIPSERDVEINLPSEKNVKDALLNLNLSSYTASTEKGNVTKYTMTTSIDSGKNIGMKKGKYLLLSPSNHSLAVASNSSDPDSVFYDYRAYVINVRENVFVITNIHKECFNKDGVYSVSDHSKEENNQIFYEYVYNESASKGMNSEITDNNIDDVIDSGVKSGTFKYSDDYMMKVYQKKYKTQTQIIIMFNHVAGEKLGMTKDTYVKFEGTNSFKISQGKPDKSDGWYKMHQKSNQWECKINANAYNIKDGDYSLSLSKSGGKYKKVKS